MWTKQTFPKVLKDYRPVSLLPNWGKIFEKSIFNALYSFFEDHKLLNQCKSGFKENDSSVNQRVSIIHEIYCFLLQSLSPDLSKAFDKVWHDSVIYAKTIIQILIYKLIYKIKCCINLATPFKMYLASKVCKF